MRIVRSNRRDRREDERESRLAINEVLGEVLCAEQQVAHSASQPLLVGCGAN